MHIDWKEIFNNSNFWGVQYAKKAIDRAKKKNKEYVVLKGASTPTGVLHIGNANEVIRNYFIAKSIEILGYKYRFIYTCDDRDPIRGFPKNICDREGNIIPFPEDIKKEFEEKYDGFCVRNIPDPFKCHFSWAEHFLDIFFKELKKLGIDGAIKIERYSPDILYFSREWEKFVKIALKNTKKINEILSELKEHVRKYPFSIICENCGKIGTTHALDVDIENNKVKYICEKRKLKKRDINGCGYRGVTTLSQGKLDWYIEWAVNWAYFEVDLEPMGKEHYNSSWKISPKIAKTVFNIEPPIPMVYEFFLVNGEKMSGSKGNIINLTELLKMLDPEVIIYFFSKRPNMARNLNLSNLNLLVDEFWELEKRVYDTLEKINRGEITISNLKDGKFVSEHNLASLEDLVIYYLCMRGDIKDKKPIRIPYNFASILGQLINTKESLKKILIRTQYIKNNISEEELEYLFKYINKAKYWVLKYGPDMLKINITENPSKIKNPQIREALKEIIEILKKIDNWDPENIQTKIHYFLKENNLVKDFYPAIYRSLLNKERGPKLGTIFSILGKEKTLELLSRML